MKIARTTRLLATVVCAFALAACGGGDGDGQPGAAEPAASGATGLPADKYPRTVQTVRGEVKIESAPQRIVVLDGQSLDTLVALKAPIAAYDLGSDDKRDVAPWLSDVPGEFKPGLVGADGSVDVQAVLAADPDLIVVDPFTAKDGEVYKRLSAIAPVLTEAKEAVLPWQERTRWLADALGIPEVGARVITETEAKLATAKAEVPGLAGKSYHYVAFSEQYGGLWFGNGAWLETFGMVPGKGQVNTHEEFNVVSLENVSDFDADVLVIWAMAEADRKKLEADARFQALPSVKNGLVLWMDYSLAIATNTPGPGSILYMRDVVTPKLASAVQ